MERIHEVTKSCFNAVIELRSLDPALVTSPQLVYQRMCDFIENMRANANQAGYEQRDVEDITYALVALADEIALHKGGATREAWVQRPLQLHFFNENLAGEGFFRRLAALMSEPQRVDTLRVYYTCLLLGFQGQFSIRGGELELDTLTHQVSMALGRLLDDRPLSVQPLPPRESMLRHNAFPALWAASLLLLFSLGVLVVMRLSLDRQTASVVERMQHLERAQEHGQ